MHTEFQAIMPENRIFLPSNKLAETAQLFKQAVAAHYTQMASVFTEAEGVLKAQGTEIPEPGRWPLDIERGETGDRVLAAIRDYKQARTAIWEINTLAERQGTDAYNGLICPPEALQDALIKWLPIDISSAIVPGRERAWYLPVSGKPTLHWGKVGMVDVRGDEVACAHVCQKTQFGYTTIAGIVIAPAHEMMPVPVSAR